MLKAVVQDIKPNLITRYKLLDDSVAITYSEVISRLRNDASFRRTFTKLLVDSPFEAYRWETPPLSLQSQKNDFEFVLINAPRFVDRQTDKRTFQSKFTEDDKDFGIVNFTNLSGDATMVVPSPQG